MPRLIALRPFASFSFFILHGCARRRYAALAFLFPENSDECQCSAWVDAVKAHITCNQFATVEFFELWVTYNGI